LTFVWRFTRFLTAVSILSLSIGLSVGQAVAQTMDGADDIARLSDEEVRRLLLEKLQTTNPGNRPDVLFNPAVVAVRFQRNFAKVKERGGKIVAAFAEFSSLPGRWWGKMTDGRDGRAFGKFFLVFTLATAIGLLAAMLMKRWLRNTATRSLGQRPINTLSLATQAAGGLGIELAAVLVAGVTSTAAGTAYSCLYRQGSSSVTRLYHAYYCICCIRVLCLCIFWRTGHRRPCA